MARVRMILQRLLHPTRWALIAIPPPSFAALIYLFTVQNTQSAPAYATYGMSAYSLAIWIAAIPRLTNRIKSAIMGSEAIQKVAASQFVIRYLHDPAFRGSISIYRGMAVNFFYVAFRLATGIIYASVWFISIAIYDLALGALRMYLIINYHRRDPALEKRCYRRTAQLLFLLNIPMGGMIAQMIWKNSGYFYPGYVVYLSAIYAFYAMTAAILRLIRFRRLNSPILSAAGVLSLVSAMMSILGLQTAMIARFSENAEGFRRMMNAATGGCIYIFVILIAAGMLLRGRKNRKEGIAR